MADNFENLGFQVSIDGADSAVSHLDKIVDRLKKIKSLKDKSGIQGVSKGKSGSSSSSNLTDEEKWEKQYQDRMRKQAYYLKQGYINQKDIISDHVKWVLAEEKKLEKKKFLTEQGYITPKQEQTKEEKWDEQYKNNLARKEYYLKQGYIKEKQILTEEERLRESFEKAKRRRQFGIENGYIIEKQNLSDIEKYLKRVTAETEKLNDKKYEEARKIELANQKRKQEIDQRLKQELGYKKTTNALAKYIAKLTSAIALSRMLARFVSGAVKESASYTENLVLFQTAFGNSSKQQLDWALGIADAYGLARNEVVKFAGTFRQLSSSLGIVDKTADIASETVTKLGYDLSALFNTSVEDAMDALQTSIFAGQSKPLRRYGIDITQTQIDALFETNEALAGLGVNARNLTQADKAIARLIITLKSGKNAFGTMSEEINNLQSQIRIFQGSLSNFKLAIGNLVNEPLGTAIAYINGFIIAMTNIVNAFAPKKEETVIDNVTLGAEEANDAIDELNDKLADFDKFNVLGGQSNSGNSSLAVTEALNKLLEEQVDLYDTEYESALNNMNNAAITASKNIIGWFVKVDENGEIVFEDGMPVWTESAKLLGASLLAVGGIISGKVLVSVANFVGSLFTLKNAISIAETALIGGIIYSVVRAVEAFRDGEYWVGALAVAIGVTLAGALIAIEVAKHRATNAQKQYTKALIEHTAALTANTQALQKNSTKMQAANIEIKKTTASITAMEKATAAMSVAFAVGGLATLWSSEGNAAQKMAHTFIGLAAAISAAAIAIAAFKQNWAQAVAIAGTVAGGYWTVSSLASTQGFADGGYTNANLIMTHENGKREWVGKAAGSSAIVNDTQMSDIMEGAVAKGVYSALTANRELGGKGSTKNVYNFKVNGKTILSVMEDEMHKQGKKLATV